MRANKLQTYWIVIQLTYIALSSALKVFLIAFFSKKQRASINTLATNWSKDMLAIVKAHYKIFNPLQVTFAPNQHYIIMSNHCSHFDIPLIYVTFPNKTIRMIAKKELFKIPIWGPAMRKAEFIMADRGNREQASQVLKQAREKMLSGVIPWIAPEGTRSSTGKLQAFKKGGFILAIETKATIIPVGIRGSRNILPTHTLNFGLNENIDVHIGAPITTENYGIKNIKQLMQRVEASILQATGEGKEHAANPNLDAASLYSGQMETRDFG